MRLSLEKKNNQHIVDKQDKKSKLIPEQMNACLFYGPRDIRYEQIPIPEISDEEILVKVKTVLTCGTDLKTFQRSHPKLIRSIPSTFGHQFSGIIVNKGNNVYSFKLGQKIIALNSAPCFKCTYCKRKQYSICENIEFLNGAYAEYIKVPERILKHNTYIIPENIDFKIAAILESLSVVIHGIEKSEITKDKTVCIIGTGSIGLLYVILLKLIGARVISIGRKESKLLLARKLGANYIVNLNNYSSNSTLLLDHIKNITNKVGPDVVIEAAGYPELWQLATEIVCKGGLVNFFGGCSKGTQVQLDTYRIHYDELKLVGVFHHTPEHVKKALELMKNNSILVDKIRQIITHKLPLNQLEEAFHLHEAGKAIQVAIEP